MRPAIILDRDGTINEDVNYLTRKEQLKLCAGAGEALRLLQELGFILVVITNQSAIARGYLTEEHLAELHKHLEHLLEPYQVHLSGIYYCPHHPQKGLPPYNINCHCRKPQPGLLLQAIRELDLDPARSYAIGDKWRDLVAAQKLGLKTILVHTGYGASEAEQVQSVSPQTHQAATLLQAAQYISRHIASLSGARQ